MTIFLYIAGLVVVWTAGIWVGLSLTRKERYATRRELDVLRPVHKLNQELGQLNQDLSESLTKTTHTMAQTTAELLKWQSQATVLASQNDRLLNELAEARADATASTRDILAAFTGPPPATDGPQPDSPPSPQTQLDEALADAFSLEDWTDNITDPLGAPPTTPPPFLADIPAVEDHDA